MTIRRMKTYTGGQGYVYQYYFVGKRAAIAKPSATEYVFDVTSDRKTTFAVSVFLTEDAIRGLVSPIMVVPSPKPNNTARSRCASSRPSMRSRT